MPRKKSKKLKYEDHLSELVENASVEALEEYLDQLPAGETAHTISQLDSDEVSQLFEKIHPDDAAHLIEHLPNIQAAGLIEELEPETAAAIISELPSDEQADLLGELEAADVKAILAEMDPQDAQDAQALTLYAEDVAGGLMITEFVSYPQTYSVGQVLEDLRRNSQLYRDYEVQYLYIVNAKQHPVGVLRIRDLILAQPSDSLTSIMATDPQMVGHYSNLESLEDFFDHTGFLGVPVIDDLGAILGVVRRSAVQEALANRRESDFRKSKGIIGGEELRGMPLSVRSSRRLGWLAINIVLNLLAASVIAMYQDTLTAVIALAVFIPIISDMSGCSGNQAVAVSIRELALGIIRPGELWRVWIKEIAVGIINGILLGGLIALVAWVWQGNIYLGFVVGAALAVNTMIAVSIGGLIPLVLKSFNKDPALASGPILTTVTDMCGFFLVLSIATWLLPLLIAN